MAPQTLSLANGWTVSVATDTLPAFCSVAAWPTACGDAPRDQSLWFDFTRTDLDPPADQRDRRCWTLDDVCEALKLVQDAAPPPARDPPPSDTGGITVRPAA